MDMPSDMNGLLKSITRSRSDVIVMGAMAMSASCANNETKYVFDMINEKGDNFVLQLIALVDGIVDVAVAIGVGKLVKLVVCCQSHF